MGIFNFAGHINRIARITNKWVMTLNALTIAFLLLSGADAALIFSTWILFIIISSIFTINGILLILSFRMEVRQFSKQGKPVKGILGFEELKSELNKSALQSFLITLASVTSFVLYYVSKEILSDSQQNIISLDVLALAMAFLAVSVMFLVEYPADPSFTPGGLIGFYEPDNFPIILDNLLTDVFTTYLDPATFMRFDEWKEEIVKILDPEFESDDLEITRAERAIEKILLLAYLSHSNSELFTEQVVNRELIELFTEGKLDHFKQGKNTGLEWDEIVNIIKQIEKQTPEPFRLVDRLMVNLTDNYQKFIKEDLYFTVAAKVNQGAIYESTGIIAFFINKTKETDRLMIVKLDTDIETVHPARQKIHLKLDAYNDEFPEIQPPIIGDGEDDILGILSDLLQVGDAIWFRVQPRGFGYRLISIVANEPGKNQTLGRNLEVRFTKALSWYFKTYAPKLSALGSLALPTIQAALNI